MSVVPAPLALLLLVVALLTAAGTAVRSVSRIWLRHWAERRLRGAALAETFVDRPQRLIFAAGAGTALCVVLGGILLARSYAGGAGRLAGALALGALLLLLAGQVLPRAIARRWAPQVVRALLPLLAALEIMLSPVLSLARSIVARLDRTPSHRPERDGLSDLLREGELEGIGERDEIAIITGVVEFGEKLVGQIMTPREELFALPAETETAELARRIAGSGYSRVPVYRGSPDDIIGMIHVFDVFKADAGRPVPRPVARAGAQTRCNDLLFEMLRKRRHLAVVQDGTGRTLGIVTLEDLLEELVGDIRDEHDEPLPGRQPAAS